MKDNKRPLSKEIDYVTCSYFQLLHCHSLEQAVSHKAVHSHDCAEGANGSVEYSVGVGRWSNKSKNTTRQCGKKTVWRQISHLNQMHWSCFDIQSSLLSGYLADYLASSFWNLARLCRISSLVETRFYFVRPARLAKGCSARAVRGMPWQ